MPPPGARFVSPTSARDSGHKRKRSTTDDGQELGVEKMNLCEQDGQQGDVPRNPGSAPESPMDMVSQSEGASSPSSPRFRPSKRNRDDTNPDAVGNDEDVNEDGKDAQKGVSGIEDEQVELERIRELLRPPPILGVENWGIKDLTKEPVPIALATKLAKFSSLKHDLHNPKHFNDSLMSNRSFHNPHLYAKMVEFVNVDEGATNFDNANVWSLGLGVGLSGGMGEAAIDHGLNANPPPSVYTAEHQKARAEQQSSSSKQRTKIDFASSSSASTSSTTATAPIPAQPRGHGDNPYISQSHHQHNRYQSQSHGHAYAHGRHGGDHGGRQLGAGGVYQRGRRLGVGIVGPGGGGGGGGMYDSGRK
ncbi:hypothetical protein AX16_007620 [Volvariella volvacea WC 439]|nr:hypothetical protein AX16_007620 [Volvariella volvacea WC 439]